MTPEEHYHANKETLDANDARLQKILEDRAVRDAIHFILVAHQLAHNSPVVVGKELIECTCRATTVVHRRLTEADYDLNRSMEAAILMVEAMRVLRRKG